MNYRLSFIFRAGNSGWSEQWYLVASWAPAAVPGFILTQDFLANFLGLRGDGVILQALRINDADNPRASFLAIVNVKADDFNGPIPLTGEEPAVAALGYCLTATGKHRAVMVRGLIDQYVNRDPADQPVFQGGIRDGLAFYLKAILQKGLCIRYLLPADAVNNPDRWIMSMAPRVGDANATTITHVAGAPLDEDFPVIIHGVPRSILPGYQGPLPIYNGTNTTVDVPVVWRAPSTVMPVQNAYIRNALYAYDPVIDISWEDFRTKRVGRPTILTRGRRSGIKYRAH
jgi:hypothetical protein